MLKNNIIKKFKGLIPFILYQNINKEHILTISKNYLYFTFFFLKKHIFLKYNLLTCISGVDLMNKKYRFCIAYDLLSLTFNTRLRIKIFVDEIGTVPTLTSVFINSNWWEREIWDLFGIYFLEHPDLRRILTDYGFEGHPLKKDFPLSGYIELRYDIKKKRIISEPLELSQEFRSFSFEIPW